MTDTTLTENALAKVSDEQLIRDYKRDTPRVNLGTNWDEDAYRQLVINEMAARFAAHHRELELLVSAGLTAPESLDYYMVEVAGRTQSAWAEARGISQGSVSENVSKAKQKLVE